MVISMVGVRNEDLVQAHLALKQKTFDIFLIQFINLSKTIAADFSRTFQNTRASFFLIQFIKTIPARFFLELSINLRFV